MAVGELFGASTKSRILELIVGGGSLLELFLDNVFSLHCSPTEFIRIFELTKRFLLTKKMTKEEYLEFIRQNVNIGLSPEDIESVFKKRYEN